MTEYIHVDDSEQGRVLGPVAFARRVYDAAVAMKENGEDRTVSGELATVRLENNQYGGFQIKIQFHEKQMVDDFEFHGSKAAARNPMDLGESVATQLDEFTGEIGELANILTKGFDMTMFEFAKLDAASISGSGTLTDYEFVYETGSLDGPPNKETFEDRLVNTTGAETIDDIKYGEV